MNGKPKVTVLMASFNGERYIQEQLNSVLASSGVAVDLIVRDDGSSDSTVDLLAGYGDRVTFLKKESTDKNYGHLANFTALCDYALHATNSDYYAFCDQDDVWFPEKLAVLVEHIQRIELDGTVPALVHSDLRIVDSELNTLSNSFWRYQGLPNPAEHRLDKLMYQNVVTGCACLFNRALLENAAPVPKQAVVHDYWFALVAKAIGRVDFVDRPLLAYRQHRANSIGSIAFADQRSYFKNFVYKMAWRYPNHLAAAQLQVRALLDRVGDEINSRAALEAFAHFEKHSALMRLREGHRLLQTSCKRIDERLYLSWVFLILRRVHRKRLS